jgi:hypothetical protein
VRRLSRADEGTARTPATAEAAIRMEVKDTMMNECDVWKECKAQKVDV